MKRILAVIMVVCILSGCAGTASWQERYDCGNEPLATIAYIPLDNRPVNTTRAAFLAQSAGFELLMPEESLYRTALDGQQPNPNKTQYGEGEAILSGLESCDADYYVVSLDQILSGGLVYSRYETKISEEYDRLDRLLTAIGGKNAVLFDTVMRLAPTVGYMGTTLEDYQALREYGMQPRPEIAELTVQNIIGSYPVETALEPAVVSRYHEARARKLQLADYLLTKVKELDSVHLYYGIDDSSPQNTIQTNEIAWIEANLPNGEIFPGTDELGLMAIARIITDHFGAAPSLEVHYFGAEPSAPADAYDTGSLESNLAAHMQALNLQKTTNPDVDLLILGAEASEAEAGRLLTQYNSNMQNGVPTMLVNLAEPGYLEKELLLSKNTDISWLLAYSGWNTAGNAIGIALSNGLARWLYLQSGQAVADANAGFLQGLAFSFAKDISYDCLRPSLEQAGTLSPGFMLEQLNNRQEPLSFASIAVNLEGRQFLTSLVEPGYAPVPTICITRVTFPWQRSFEADLELKID